MPDWFDIVKAKLACEVLTPVAKEAGERLADIVNLAFTPIMMARRYRDMKMEEFYIQKFLTELQELFSRIPNDKIDNPPPDIVGPAVESVAKYYYSRDDIRKMFAQLVASSMNKDTSSKVHPAFGEIIKQLSTNDIRILNSNYLFCRESNGVDDGLSKYERPICDVAYRRKSTQEIVCIAAKDYIFLQHYFPQMNEREFNLSLENLSRLNLITIDISNDAMSDAMIYQEYEDTHFIQTQETYRSDTAFSSNEYELSLIRKTLQLTDFGFSFVEMCIG